MSIVRESKFRHIFGTPSKKEHCYENISITRSSYEAKFAAVNSKFLAVCIYSGGGGAFLVIPLERVGRQDINSFKVAGHTSDVLDLEWNPFNDHMIASSDEDGYIHIWEIPSNGLTSDLTAPLVSFCHERKCTQLSWHPSAANILLSVSLEPLVTVWNLESGDRVTDMEHPEQVYNAEWNFSGSKVVTACKDKKFRIFNPRTGEVLQTISGHKGGKPQRVIFIEDDKLLSTGFTKMSSRQYSMWDLNDPSEPFVEDECDAANGTLIPYYDRDIKIVYLAGKGDGTIRYYEINNEEPFMHWIANFSTKVPHRAVCFAPKRACNVLNMEVARCYRLISDKHLVEPVSFTVPRKKTGKFDESVFPPTAGDSPALTADEWFGGKDSNPIMMSLDPKQEGTVSSSAGKPSSGGLGSKVGLKPMARKSNQSSSEGGSIDSGLVKELRKEITDLKTDLASVKSELTEMHLLKKEVLELTATVKKNSERVTVLESLVQEVSDEEGK